MSSEKLGEPRIHSVLLSWQMKAVVDVLTCCKTSALDTAAHSSSMNASLLISDRMETIGPEHPGLGLNEQTLQFSSHAHRRSQRKGFLSSVGRV